MLTPEEADDARVPLSIPPFCKRQRHFSRVADDISCPFAMEEFYDDLPYCTKPQPSTLDIPDFSHLQAGKYSTSTPFTSTSTDLFRVKSELFHQDHAMSSSLAKICLDSSKDSGRWSMDTLEAQDIEINAPLPRLSLETTFDKVRQEDTDSAYESECLSQLSDNDLVSSCSSTIFRSLSAKLTSKPAVSQCIQEVLQKFSPPVPDRLIGRRMGRDTVDIVEELSVRNMSGILSNVLRFVEREDLCQMSCVSKAWKGVCENDTNARRRRKELLKEQKAKRTELQKENVTIRRRSPRKKRSMTSATSLLGDVQAAAEDTSQTGASQLLPSWQEEASKLRLDESLRKCPQCSSPSRTVPAQERAMCTHCSYDFCTHCLCAFHGSSLCSTVTLRKKSKTDTAIGTRKSKKNLRRL